MNTSTTPRLLAMAVMTCLYLIGAQSAFGQCADFISYPAGPVSINMTLGAGGTVNLTNAVLNANGFVKNAACDFWLSTNQAGPYTNTPITFTCSDVAVSPQTWYVRAGGTGAIGNNGGPGSTIVPITVTIIDNLPPTITTPAGPFSRNTDPGFCRYTISGIEFDPTAAADNCTFTLQYNIDGGSWTPAPMGNTLNGIQINGTGAHTIQWRITDASNNQVTAAAFTVNIADNQPATVLCPGNLSVGNDMDLCSAVVNSIAPVTSDNCSVTGVTWSTSGATTLSGSNDASGSSFNVGMTTVTYVATDGVNPPAMCSFDITVNDVQDPYITCPPSLTVDTDAGACNAVVNSIPPASFGDNCAFTLVGWANIGGPALAAIGPSLTDISGSTFDKGTTIVQYDVQDAAGLTATCTFTVTVEDNELPTVVALPPGPVTFVGNFNVNVAPGACNQTVTWYRPSPATHNAFDNCPGALTLTEAAPIMPNGNTDPTFFTTNGVTPYPYDFTNFLHWVTPVSAEFPVGTTKIPYVFADANGNTDTVFVTVTVNETEKPVANCVAGIVTLPLNGSGTATLLASQVNNGSTDNCGIASLTVAPSMFTCSNVDPMTNVTVTLTVSDYAGNTSTCTATVDIIDNQPVTMQCPTNRVLNASSVAPHACSNNDNTLGMTLEPVLANLGPGEFFDNSAACGIGQYAITYSLNGGAFNPVTGGGDPLASHEFALGTTNVTVKVQGPSGIPVTCTFTVSVKDVQVPTANNCPASVSLPANSGGCLAAHTWTVPSWSDNCAGTLTLNPAVPSGTTVTQFFFFGPNIVNYTATDAAGNVGTCSFTVTVFDNQAPVANCKPFTAVLGAGGSVTVPAINVDNNSTDNCFFSRTLAPNTFNCGNLGANTVTLTLTDGSGNTATCTATVTVVDNTAPTALCNLIPASVSLSATSPGTFVMNASAVGNGTDNCPGSLTYEISVDGSTYAPSYSFNCSHIGNRMVSLKAKDGGNNTNICGPVQVTVKDLSAPSFTVPSAKVIDCNDANANLLNPNINTTLGVPTNIVDNCDGAPTVTFSDNIATVAGCPNALNITRTWTVTDHATPANSSTQTQVIQVRDITPPVWTMTNTYSVNTNAANSCSAPSPVPAITSAQVADACGSLNITYSITYPTPNYGFTNIPAGTPLPLSGIASATFPVGVSTIVYLAIDECGNTAANTVTVTVVDTQAPVFSYNKCGQTYTLPNTTNSCDQLYTWTRPNASDLFDCKAVTVTESFSDATVANFINLVSPFNWPPSNPNVIAQFPVGETTVTYKATDASNNTATCTFKVKILDTQAPVIACPGNQVLSISSGCTGITTVPNYTNGVQITDNCVNNIQLTQTPTPGLLLSNIVPVVAGQTFTVFMKATDGQPNSQMSNTCSFTVTLADGTAPVPNILPTLPPIVSFCSRDTVEAPSATDCNGSAFVTIYGTPSVPVQAILPPLVPGGPPRYVLNAGNYAITWSYTDAQNNTTTQLQSVNIQVDNIPPIAICSADSVNLDVSGVATILPALVDNGSYDQHGCGPLSYSFKVGNNYVNSLTFNCGNIGVNTVTFAATDINGNTALCTTTIKVKDVNAPIILVVPANITLNACDNIPAQETLNALDVCDASVTVVKAQTSTQGTTNENCNYYSYTITRTWTATDDSNNKTTVTQTITVQDIQAPVFAANTPDSIVVFTDANRLTCDDTISLNVLNYLTDCAPDSELTVINTLNPVLGANITGIYPVGSQVVTFTATDKCGNSSTKSIKLVVKDGTPPTAVCINGISVSLQPSGTVSIGTSQANNNSFDNCGGPLTFQIQRLDPLTTPAISIGFDCSDADGVTHHPVKLYVKDPKGNQSTCETYVVVQDNVAPVISFCPPNKTVQCSDNLLPATQGVATTNDNCPGATVTYADTLSAGNGNTCQVLTRTWKAKDLAGNQTICHQILSIQDTIKPSFNTLPPNITISCNDALVAPPTLTASDNCDLDVVVSMVVDTTDLGFGDCGKFSYTVQRTWTAIDDCGNTKVYTQEIVVQDVTDPQFLGMPDTIVLNSADFAPNLNCSVPVDLDIKQFLEDCSPDSLLLVTNDAPQGDMSSIISGDYAIGSYMIHFSAIDACGNVGLDSILLVIKDNSIPTAICNNNVVISLGSAGTASIDPNDIDLGSTDNCAIDTMWLSQTDFDCTQLGANQIQLFVQDIYGNTNSCTVNVSVELGTNSGFSLSATATAETYFGADNGSASATVSGGSGQFSYLWSNSATTANISGLHAGTYTVTVTDQLNGCIATATVTVDEGARITLSAGTASGCQNGTVTIPVTVDNFVKINGFSFTMNLSNTSVGTPASISNVTAALAGLVGNPLPGGAFGLVWANSGAPLSLPNGTVLFNLNINLGTAAIGTTSSLNFSATPLQFEFDQDSSGIDVILGLNEVDINNGLVTINCAVSDLKIGGDIQTWKVPTKPVPNTTVNLTGTSTQTQTTPLAGTYLFMVGTGANTTVTPTKVTTGNDGVTAADLLFITNHIFSNLLPSPYQWVAADANGDGNITLNDYLRIQRVALGTDQHILGSPDWKFIPKSYVFPTPNPLSTPYPQTISHTNVTADFTDDDFVAVRMGDVNGNITPSITSDDAEDRNGTFYFQLDEQQFQSGDMVTVPFRAKDFVQQKAYQLTVDFDPNVFELADIGLGALPKLNMDNFGTTHLEDGHLTTLWVNHEGTTLKDGEVLFTLTFKALRSSNVSSTLHAGSEITRAEAYSPDGAPMHIDFDFVQPASGTELAPFALYQNQPNPFQAGTTISFRLPESGRASVRVYNMSGQLVKTVIGNFAKGYNEVQFNRQDLGEAGVYWYELETATHSDRKKMILID